MYGTFTGHPIFSKYFSSPINAGVLAMVLGLVLVPIVSMFTSVKDKKNVDKMFSCYDNKVTVHALTALEDEEK